MSGRRPRLAAATVEVGANGDIRCGCHRLLARWLPEGLELRCTRCKETLLVPTAALDALPVVADAAE
ncbi:MAG: hypothetical protein AAF447_17810 [Myxococcota bacterium]